MTTVTTAGIIMVGVVTNKMILILSMRLLMIMAVTMGMSSRQKS